MKTFVLLLSMAAFAGAAVAQTPSQSSAAGASAPKAATATAHKTTVSETTLPPWIKLPPGIPRVVHGPVHVALALHYEDIKVGTGPLGESGKLWHIKYTGWRAADGVEFDSWEDHKRPKTGPDGKPVMGADGKPMMGDPEPLEFPQGLGRVIPGFDYALDGMHIGGKRRVFIPWELAYGTRTIPDRPDHPGIPPKSDLIFDVELVAVTDMPVPPQRPMFAPHPMPPHPGAPGAPGSAPKTEPGSPSAPAAPNAAPKPAAPSSTPNPAQPSTQPSTTHPSTPQSSAPPSSTQQPSTPQPPTSTTAQPQSN
jgi:peptidylprolyl isomerase